MEYPQMQLAGDPWRGNIPAPWQTTMPAPPGQDSLRAAALRKVRESLSGPYSEATQTNMISRGADATAAAEAQAQEQLRQDAASRGLSPTDPGLQSAQREATAARQQANQGYASDVRNRAAEANFQGGLSAARLALAQPPQKVAVLKPGGISHTPYSGIDMSPRQGPGDAYSLRQPRLAAPPKK